MKAIGEILKKSVRDPLKDRFWAIYGRRLRNPSPNPDARSILFVCTGNICRSPFCAGIAGKLSREYHLDGILCESAGIQVSMSLAPPKEAILIAERFGVDLREHRSREVDAGLLRGFDVVVAMEAWQYRTLRTIYPGFKKKIFLLPLFDAGSSKRGGNYETFNIADPFGKSPEEFHRCFQRIEKCVNAFLTTVK